MAVDLAQQTQSLDNFRVGNRGLLILMGSRYLVAVLSVTEDTVVVSFPANDFPIDGMRVDLEFHDVGGYATYETEVLHGPREAGDGVVLRKPETIHLHRHRTSWRVPVDFKAELKDHVHPRVHEVPVINISAGGLLVRTMADLKMNDDVDITFTIPNGPRLKMVAQVMHVSLPPSGRAVPASIVGLQFVGVDPVVQQQIVAYTWRRVREIYPEDLRHLRRRSDRIGAGG